MNIVINQSLITGTTFLTSDITASTSALPVRNSEAFVTANGLLLIGEIGSPNAELIPVISSKTAQQINLGSPCSLPHQVGEPVYQVTFNQVEIQSSNSPSGPFTTLDLINIQWSQDSTIYNDTTGTSATYYRQRFYNTVTTVYSDWSNSGTGVAQADYGMKTAGYLINQVRKSIGNVELKDDFFINALNEARGVANTQFGYGRMNEWRQQFDYPIQMLAGTNYINLPDDIDFTETNRTLLNVRFARQSVAANIPINYIDKREWNMRSYLNRYSFTNGATISGATSLTLDSTGDFPSNGTVFIATENSAQSILIVNYTGNNLLTNTLTGCTGITRNVSSGVQIMNYSTFAYPYFYTVFDNKIWFDRAIPTSLQGKNCYIDYYKAITPIVFLNDEIPEHYRSVYADYLKFAVKRRRDDSLGENDEDYKRFKNGLATILGNPWTGQTQIIIQ